MKVENSFNNTHEKDLLDIVLPVVQDGKMKDIPPLNDLLKKVYFDLNHVVVTGYVVRCGWQVNPFLTPLDNFKNIEVTNKHVTDGNINNDHRTYFVSRNFLDGIVVVEKVFEKEILLYIKENGIKINGNVDVKGPQ